MTSPTGGARDASAGGVERPAGGWLTVARRRLPYGPDLLFGLLALLLAGWLTQGLWPDPGGRIMALNPEDQALYEWFLAYDTHFLTGDPGLVTDLLNAPDGVNLLANTSVIGLGVLFAPLTLLAGAPVTFAVIVPLNPALSAIAWYALFRRITHAPPLAAGIGGSLVGFAPGMVSQSISHLHMTAQWLVPVIIWMVVRLLNAANDPGTGATDRRRVITSGLALAAVIVTQVFIGEEVLFLTAFTLTIITIGYAVARPALVRRVAVPFAAGMALAAAAATVLLAYPLWIQFAGPQSVRDTPFLPGYFVADLASFAAFSPLSVAGSLTGTDTARLSTGPTEYNTFLGWPLLLVTAGCLVWLRRRPIVFACGVASIVMAAMSLGPEVVIDRERTGVPGPFRLLAGLPVVESALPMRFALALVPLIATVLVLAVQLALSHPHRIVQLVPALAIVALLPLLPKPLPTSDREPLPRFITAGHWRDCVEPGGVLVPVPPPTPSRPWAMRWAAATNTAFALPEGFFIGPYANGGRASMGVSPRSTSALLATVARTGVVPVVAEPQRSAARGDIAFWRARCLALTDDTPRADPLRRTLEALFGPGTRAADAWYWRFRP